MGDGLTDKGDLTAIGNDDAYGLCRAEVFVCETVDATQQVGHQTGLILSIQKQHLAMLQQFVEVVLGG